VSTAAAELSYYSHLKQHNQAITLNPFTPLPPHHTKLTNNGSSIEEDGKP
jgi:hypothetical protein